MLLLREFFAHAKLSGILDWFFCTEKYQTNRLPKIFTLCFDESYDIALAGNIRITGNIPSAIRQPDSIPFPYMEHFHDGTTSGAYLPQQKCLITLRGIWNFKT
jgi:hypothetical protein